MSSLTAPVSEQHRITSLDTLRGFALLGIFLLNIIGFAQPSAAYSVPGVVMNSTADVVAWASMELFAEGAMRALFSMLFGAGVVLFTTGEAAKAAGLHFKRNFWLLALGLFDAYVLLWNGDILVNYALAGFLLYLVRNSSARRLLVTAGVLMILLSVMYGVMGLGMGMSKQAASQVASMPDVEAIAPQTRQMADSWLSFKADFGSTADQTAQEIDARTKSYASAFLWNVDVTNEMLLFVMPAFLFWDALLMMLIGMALFKMGVLQGQRSNDFYLKLSLIGFAVGLGVNAYEVYRAISHDFSILSTFAQMQPTYHFGRLGVAMGWMGLLLWLLQLGRGIGVHARLAAVGRMALTNYLSHSLICLVVFTGAGFALLGQFSRAEMYLVVVGIWIFQLWFSPWWLARYRFGPVEWLWRTLTYGQRQPMRRST